MGKMNDAEIVKIIQGYRRESLGYESSELSNERAAALDHYHGRPYGNEEEGRSQIVSKDLAEAVDWAMPAIMRVFTQSGALGEFEPVGPEDEDAAKQETDYLNRVIMQDNPGWLILHDVFKDTLLLKNGYCKHYWHETETVKTEEYSGLLIHEVSHIMQQLQQDGAEVEIVGQEEKIVTLPDQMGNPVTVPAFDVKIKIKRKNAKVVIEAVPTEEVRISRSCRGSLQDAAFVEHVTKKTRSDLIEMGMPRSFVDTLPSHNEKDNNSEVIARDSVSDESSSYGASFNDSAMDEIEFCEAYIRIDYDGDGVAELRKIVTVANKIPPGEEWNEEIEAVPMTGFVCKRMPHRHVGESLDDDIADLQEIKTVLIRQLFDNIYLTNNNQWLVNERVNLQDFMQSLPGGVKRVEGLEPVTGSVEPVITAPIVQQILPVVDYVDGIKESRTGISKAMTGLDPDVLQNTTKGAFMENMAKASQKVEMLTRMLAETGVKELVLNVHGLLLRHQDKPRMVKLHGKYVSVNPAEWRERNDLVVKVGLGNGTEDEKRQRLMMMKDLQGGIASIGLVGPNQAYALYTDLAENLGFERPEKYVMSPGSEEHRQMMQQQQQGQPDPLSAAERVKGEFMMQKAQMEVQFKGQLAQMQEQYKREIEMLNMQMENEKKSRDQQLEIMKMHQDAAEARAERASREAIESAKLEMQAFLAGMNTDIGKPGIGAGLQEGL